MKKLIILFFLPISIISQEIDFFEPNLRDVPLARKYKNMEISNIIKKDINIDAL